MSTPTLETSPIAPPAESGDVLFNGAWRVDVDTDLDSFSGTFKQLLGVKGFAPTLDTDMKDATTYDDDFWKAEVPGGRQWKLDIDLVLKLYAGKESEALTAIKTAHNEGRRIHVRWYRRDSRIADGYEGFAYATYTDNGGAMDDPSEAKVTLSGQGARHTIKNPYGTESSPAPAAWQATHAYALNDLVTVDGKTLKATTAGTSGATAPTAPASVGGTVVDGSVTWTRTI